MPFSCYGSAGIVFGKLLLTKLTLFIDCTDFYKRGFVKDGHSTIGGRHAFPVFRGCGGLLLVHWFWAISVFIWRRYRINYIYLFDFNPKIVQTPMTILKDCVDETLVFLILMLLYYKVCFYFNIIPFCMFQI